MCGRHAIYCVLPASYRYNITRCYRYQKNFCILFLYPICFNK
ncbi:hypothetical protein HMPREF0663_10381 [Hoylesella oralis ATCC 33269]|uniref:Uncharacterized protein n=1 Tax=Hoylesella oralis ATCC 33269 TaxID=873533 RepID=E7RMN1_9BACT|nr:hypothetical protein HMPREF0663_10381 [Hoylesella oralis ATCC 33269]